MAQIRHQKHEYHIIAQISLGKYNKSTNMKSSTNITNTISSTPMPQIQHFGSHNNKSNLTNKFNTATSLTSRNTLTGQIRIPKLATAPPASARPEAQSMPPLIDYANRRRYKITFPSQYLLYAHASK